jgi:hypothetical protein
MKMSMEHSYNDTDKGQKTEEPEEKFVAVTLLLPQTTHGLAWDRTKASAVTGRRLTA